jgi:hypothetical protein
LCDVIARAHLPTQEVNEFDRCRENMDVASVRKDLSASKRGCFRFSGLIVSIFFMKLDFA